MTVLTVRYRRSGGIAGLDLVAEVAVTDLDEGEAAQALFADPPPHRPRAARGADRFGFELEITDGTTTRRFRWSEADVPDSARGLLAELNRRAEPSR